MRCFIAISFPKKIVAALSGIQVELKKSEADIKWVQPHQLHLTLCFFKELSSEKIASLTERINKGISDIGAFDLTLNGIGYFPLTGNPRVIWIGILNSIKLTELYNKIQGMALPFYEEALKGDLDHYSPHVTIGRVRSLRKINRLKELMKSFPTDPIGVFPVNELLFLESRLDQKGPNYFEIQRFAFKPQQIL